MDKTAINDEVKRSLEALAFLIRISGKTRQDLDRQIGQGRGFTSQVLTGRVKLRYDHVLLLLLGANVDPALYYGLLHPVSEEDRPALKKLQEMFAQFQKGTKAATAKVEREMPRVDPEEVKRLVQEHVDRVLEEKRPRRSAGRRRTNSRSLPRVDTTQR
jgi:hypothetical protein